MDADPKFDTALGRQPGITLNHAALNLDGAAHGIDHATKLDERSVAGAFDYPPMMHRDGRIDQITTKGPQARQRPLLLGTGKLAVSNHICRQNRREFPCFGHGCPCTTRQTSTIVPWPGQVVLLRRSSLAQ